MWSISTAIKTYSFGLLRQTRNFTSLTAPSNLTSFRQSIKSSPQSTSSFPSDNVSPSFPSLIGLIQRRFKSRGNTYQPNNLKRKRRLGFLARLKTPSGRNVLQRRRAKNRWFLTH